MKVYPLIIALFGCLISVSGQKKAQELVPFYEYKHEIGINVTSVLSNVLSLNPNNTNSLYGITYRRHWEKYTFRSAFNFNFLSDEDSEFTNGNFQIKKLKNARVDLRMGIERHYPLSKRVMFCYGFDILGGYEYEFSSVEEFLPNGNNQFFNSTELTLGAGAGPVLRFEYKVTPHLLLSTECSLYGYATRNTERLSINGVISDEPSRSAYNIELQLPQSLFLNIAF